jgi:hypothetical protein
MHDRGLDIAYFLASLCIAYKIAWLNRQTFDLATSSARLMRWSGIAMALLVLAKSLRLFAGGEAATLLDVARELALCGFLFSAIAHRHRRTGRW